MQSSESNEMQKNIDLFKKVFVSDNGGVVFIKGEGGSGKSELLSAIKLLPEVTEPSVINASLDFAIPINTDSELGLLSIRSELISRFKIDFSFFDVAYAYYIGRTNPNKTIECGLTVYGNSRILNEIIDSASVSGRDFADRLYYTVEKNRPSVTKWWENGGGAELAKLKNESAALIRKSFLEQFVRDLQLATDGKKCVVTIDSFENIYSDGNASDSDEWVIQLIEKLPNVFFIIVGRHLPDIACNLELETGKLNEKNTEQFLNKNGLNDKALADAVFNSARGDKFLTTLLASSLSNVKKDTGKIPAVEQVEHGAREIVLFYNSTLENNWGRISHFLSACRFFNSEIFEFLANEFIPENLNFSYSDYCSLSYIVSNIEDDCFCLKKTFRENLYASLSSDQKDSVHFSLFNFLLGKLERGTNVYKTNDFYLYFRECFYHAKASLDNEGFIDWFFDAQSKYFTNEKIGFWISLNIDVVEYLKGIFGLVNPYTASCIEKLAELYSNIEDFKQAEPLFKRNLNINEKLGGDESQEALHSRNRLASFYSAKGDFKSAKELIEKNAEIKSRIDGADHPETLKYQQKLAVFTLKDNNYTEAAEIGEKTLEMYISRYGNESAETVKLMNELAYMQEAAENHERAFELYKEVLDIREKSLGENHPETARSISALAFYFFRRGDLDSAEPLFYRALEAKESLFGAKHPLVAAFCNNLGYIYYKKEKFENAKEMYEKALKIKEKNFGSSHPSTLTGMTNLAALLYRKGDLDEAEVVFRQVLEKGVDTFGENSSEIAADLSNLAYIVARKGELEEAELLNKKAININETNNKDAEAFVISLNNLGDIFFRKGEFDEAEEQFQKAYTVAEESFGASHHITENTLKNLMKIKNKIH